jgi:hypothetical protein
VVERGDCLADDYRISDKKKILLLKFAKPNFRRRVTFNDPFGANKTLDESA